MTTQDAANAPQTAGTGMQGAKILDLSKITQDASNPCVLENDDIANSLSVPLGIDAPQAGELTEVALEPGQNYLFNFGESSVTSIVESCGDLVIDFENGGQLTLTGFANAVATDLPPVLAFAGEDGQVEAVEEAGDGEIVDISDIIEQTPEEDALEEPATEVRETVEVAEAQQEPVAVEGDSAEQLAEELNNIEVAAGDEPSAADLANIEPAAGEAGGSNGNSGFGFGSTFSAGEVNRLEDIGAIDPTALQYGVNNQNDEIVSPLDDRPEFPGIDDRTVDETDLGPNTVGGVITVDYGNDGPGAITPNGVFSIDGSLLNGELTSCGEPVIITQTATGYVGKATINGVETTIFDFTISTSGVYEFNQYEAIDHADGSDPNDVISITLGINATDADNDVTQSSITINIRDDAPSAVDVSSISLQEADLVNGDVVINDTLDIDFGNDGPGGVQPDGQPTVTGVDTLTSGGEAITIVATADGFEGRLPNDDVAFELSVDQDTGDYTFTLKVPLDNAPGDAPIVIDFGFIVDDKDGDTTDATISVSIVDSTPEINDNPTVGAGIENIDESDLPLDGTTVSGSVDVDFGVDTPGEIVTNGDPVVTGSGPNGTLTSGGETVVITESNNGYIGTVNGETVFTFTLDPQTGDYTFEQILPIDHADSDDPNDVVSIEFPVIANDSDGDSDEGTVTINIADDAPTAEDDVNAAEEGQTITGDLLVNDDLSVDEGNTVTDVTFDGQTTPIPENGSATIETDLGTLVINSDGTYTFTATDEGDPEGDLVFTYTLTDGDGDSDTADLTISVTPDGEPVEVTGEMIVDETSLTPGPSLTTGTAVVDFGLDGPGTITPNDTFSFGESVANDALTSGGVPVVVSATANGYVGVLEGTTTQVFELIITDETTGDFSFELFQTLDHADGTDPNDEILLTFGVTAQDSDDDTVDGTISILVADDAPVALDDTNSAMESETVTGNVLDNDESSEDQPTNVVEVIFDGTTYEVDPTDGVEITGQYGTLTINQDGSYSYTAFLRNPEGIDEFTYVIEDYDGDRETAELTIDVTPIDDVPTLIDNALEVVDETDLDGGNIVVGGDLDPNYGTDGPGAVTPVSFDSSGSRLNDELTSGGEPVVVTIDGDTYTGTADGETIFTLQVNEDGTYEFTLIGELDHADPDDPNDIINLEFTVQATDFDGDVTPAIITVAVKDDVPTIADSNGDVDESNLDNGPLRFSDTLFTDLGTDASNFEPANDFEATVNGTPIALTSGGDAVTVTATDDGYVGTTNNGQDPVFTITIDPDTGRYVFEQTAPLDHPDGTDPNDEISLNFDFSVSSPEGEEVTGTVTINVADDGPVAEDDTNGAEEGQTITGDALSNDDGGNDVDASVTQVVFNGTSYDVSEGNPAIVDTPLGQLTLNSDGTYSFTATDQGDPDGVVEFTYTLTDADGDTDTAVIAITVTPDGEPISVDGSTTVDETDLTPGPETVSGDINVDFGLDGKGTVSPNGDFDFGQSAANGQLTSSGEPVVVTQTADGYVGVADGETIFTLTFDSDTLTYEFVLEGTLDHANATDPNDTIELNFGITAADSDGDEIDGTITILVVDDAPVALDDTNTVGEDDTTVTGNVTNNDEASEDQPTVVTKIAFNGTEVDVDPTNGATIQGDHGTLQINADGTYTYTSNRTNANDEVDEFTYSYTDSDGDTDTAELTINVTDVDDEPELADPAPLTVDETDLNPTDTDSDTVVADFGLDGPGTYTVTGANTFGFSGATNNQLTSGGVAVVVAVVGNAYVGTANGEEVFRLDLNETTGEYEFTLTGTLDHADTTDPNDAIQLTFGVTAQDSDDDTDTGTITVNVLDDGPVAVDDTGSFSENDGPFEGNVVDNDNLSEDADNTVTQIKFGNQTVDVPADGSDVTIEGDNGTLTINNTGEYSYELNDDAFNNQTVYSFNIDNPPGSSAAGDITNVNTSYNDATQDFTFSMTVENTADGFTLAVNDGPNPKGHGGELALFYFDATGTDPVVSVYNYNGQNTQTSWQDGSAQAGTQAPDQIVNSIANPSIFGNITAVDNGDGTVTYTFNVDASVIQDHNPAYGNAADWTGVEFADQIGVWLHPIEDLTTDYDSNGFLTQWDGGSQSWYDNSNANTHVTVTGEECVEDQFTYVLTDGDGDTSEADLDVKVYADDSPVFSNNDDLVVDETDLNPTDTDSDVLNVDFGRDGPGTFEVTGVNTFGFSGATNNQLTSGGTPVTVSLDGNAYVGSANGSEVFRLELNETTGEYEFILTGTLDHADDTDPNDVITLRFGVTARDADGDTETGVVNVKVFDDGPSIDTKAEIIDESGLATNNSITYTHTLNHDYGEDGPGSIDPTGNFEAKFEMNGANVDLTTNGQTITVAETANGYVGTAGGEEIFRLTVNDNGQYTYTQFEGIDHPDPNTPDDVIWLKFEVEIVDADGDTDTAYIVVDVKDGGPVAVDDTSTVDNGGTVTGNVINNDVVGPDDPGMICAVNGLEIGSNGRTIQGQYGTLTINQDGSYSYQANAGAPEGSVEEFLYTLKDADGDSDGGKLSITIDKDDQPHVSNDSKTVDETGGFDTVSGQISVNYGGDGPGTTMANGSFSSSDSTLTSCGETINVTNNGTTYTGTAGGRTIFTMTINSDGSYTFRQLDQIDHPDPNNSNDNVALRFGVKATDSDGDVGNGTITINVRDDGPHARDDGNQTTSGGTVTGNVITNDTIGADEGGSIYKINNLIIPAGGRTIQGQFGTLTIQQDGSYVYRANSFDSLKHECFEYVVIDKDGDWDSAILNIDVHPEPDDQPVVANGSNNVDETGGFDTVSGNISVNYGGDGPGTTAANGSFSASDSSLTSLGQAISVSNNGSTYTGTAGGRTIFTMTINGNGTYTFRQHDQIDHPNAGNPNDNVALRFGVRATDSDGDTGNGTITINVFDDGPNAVDDTRGTMNDGTTITGSVIGNDSVGADAPGKITHINGQSVGSSKTINGSYGQLTINSDGSYSYRSTEGIVANTAVETFTYKLTDFDGDTDTATLRINIRDNDGPTAHDDRIQQSDFVGNIGGNRFQGNLLSNDSFGADGPGSPQIVQGAQLYTFEFGMTLHIQSNGQWTFQFPPQGIPNTFNKNYSINYTIQDKDGDTSTAKLTFTITPLALDLDGDGLEVTTVQDGVLFDYDNDGELEQTSWVKSDDALLAQDRNGDGIINDRGELFGDMFGFQHGFAHLGDLDSNGDGQITSADEQWETLIVWQDVNQDGISDANEMYSLDDVGIASIDLNAQETDETLVGDTWVSHVSTYTTTDGETHEIVDVHLDYAETDGESEVAYIAHDVIYGTEGAETFVFDAIEEEFDVIADFDASEGDQLDLSELLSEFDSSQDAIDDFVFQRTDELGNTTISVDVTGSGDIANAEAVTLLLDTDNFNVHTDIKDVI